MRGDHKPQELSLHKPLMIITGYQDESPISYLLRLAAINNYNSAHWLIKTDSRSGYTGGLPAYLKTYQLLAKYPWTGFEQLYKTQALCSLPPKYLVHNILRYCPLCLKEQRYYRITWQLKISFTCLKHKVWLVDTCSVCGQLTQYNISPLCHCKCGSTANQWTGLKKIPVKLYLLQYYLLNGSLPKSKHTHKAVIQKLSLTIEERIRFSLFLLKWLPSQIIRSTTQKAYQRYHLLAELKPKLQELTHIILTGGFGFWRVISKLDKFDNKRLERNTNKAAFIRFYRDFYSQFPSSEYQIFREIIENYIVNTWRSPITKRNVFFTSKIADDYNWVCIKEAAERFNISFALIKRAIKEQLIVSIADKKATRVFSLVYIPSIKRQLDKLKNRMSLKETQKRLGITKAQLKQLIKANQFVKAISPKQGYSAVWQFSSDTIQNYLQGFFKIATSIEGDTVTIADAMRMIGNRIENPLPTLLDRIRNLQMAVTIHKEQYDNIKALAISRKELNDWITECTDSEGYLTIPQLAKRLKINQQFAYQLINSKLITHFKAEDGKKRLITEQALTDFMDSYVFLAQLSKTTKLASHTLMDYFTSKSIYPIDYLWDTKLRLKVFDREKLKKLIILKNIV